MSAAENYLWLVCHSGVGTTTGAMLCGVLACTASIKFVLGSFRTGSTPVKIGLHGDVTRYSACTLEQCVALG